MSYWIEDANGYAGDFGSTGGVASMLAREDKPALQRFLDEGTADETLAALVADECAGDGELDYLARLFREATAPIIITDGTTETEELANERPAGADDPVVGKLMATARDLFAKEMAGDMQPLRAALTAVLQGDESGTLDRARALYAALPKLSAEIIAANGSSHALYQILSAATAAGLSKTAP